MREAAPGDIPAAGESRLESVQETGAQEEAEVQEEARYFIIAGSFRNLQNASEMQDQLKARGYPSEVMVTGDRMYRVSVASYGTKQEALRALEGIRAEPELQNSWLLSR
jgi:cell division protein FtsN